MTVPCALATQSKLKLEISQNVTQHVMELLPLMSIILCVVSININDLFGSFGYAKMSLYDRNLSLLLLVLSSALLASVSVDSCALNTM